MSDQCTCANHPGSSLTIYADESVARQHTAHDHRNCPLHKKTYAIRVANYLKDVDKLNNQPLTETRYETFEEWTTARKRFEKRAARGGETVHGRTIPQEDGSLYFIHDSQVEPGHTISGDVAKLVENRLKTLHPTKRSNPIRLVQSDWVGTRGDGRKRDSWQLKTSASVYALSERVLGAEVERKGGNVIARAKTPCTHVYISLRDFLHDELQKGRYWTLEEKFTHSNTNTVIQEIINDPLCLEVMALYGPHEPPSKHTGGTRATTADLRLTVPIEKKQHVLPLGDTLSIQGVSPVGDRSSKCAIAETNDSQVELALPENQLVTAEFIAVFGEP